MPKIGLHPIIRRFSLLIFIALPLLSAADQLPHAVSAHTVQGVSAGQITPPGSVELTLAVAAQFRHGAFTQTRTLWAPPGFQVSVFAANLGDARFMALGPQGDIFVSVPRSGKILRLVNHNGVAEQPQVYAEGLDRPHGLAFQGHDLIVAETGRLIRLAPGPDATHAGTLSVISTDLPPNGRHWTRSVVVLSDGSFLVSAGSSCNVCIETDERRATVLHIAARGGPARVYARGLRNSVGLALEPHTGELWGVDNGRDLLGDNIPPDELNRIVAGADYGWPACYGNRVPDPEFGTHARCAATLPPVVALQAHSAPLGIVFGTGLAFPILYQNMLYVAFHGSWNRSEPTGYKLVGIPFSAGRPAGPPVTIVSGWLPTQQAGHFRIPVLSALLEGAPEWGRPVAPLVGADGALYLSDDFAGAIYRISYTALQ